MRTVATSDSNSSGARPEPLQPARRLSGGSAATRRRPRYAPIVISPAVGPPPLVAVVGPDRDGQVRPRRARSPAALGGEVVNADAMQLYRGMDIGTAKLAPAERAGVPHHLLDVLDVTEPPRVADYQRAGAGRDRATAGRGPRAGARRRVRAVRAGRGGRAGVPRHRPGAAGAAGGRAGRASGPAALHARLAARRPGRGRRVLPSNGRRIVRALEVVELTGRPFAAPPARAAAPPLRRGAARAGPARPPSWTSGSPAGWTGCGRPAWSPRSRAGSPRAARRADGAPGAGLPAGAGRARRRADAEASARARDGRAPPGGSSAGSGPGSAATRGSCWLDAGAPDLVDAALAPSVAPCVGAMTGIARVHQGPRHRERLRRAARPRRRARPDRRRWSPRCATAAAGIGADGVLRVVRCGRAPRPPRAPPSRASSGSWTTATPTARRRDVRQRRPGVRRTGSTAPAG